jgi:PQQ-like domain
MWLIPGHRNSCTGPNDIHLLAVDFIAKHSDMRAGGSQVNKLPWIALRLFLPLVLISIPSLGLAQAVIWRNDWTVVSPPTLESNLSSTPFVFSPDGEVLMRASSRTDQDDQFTRFNSAGAVRWRVNIGDEGFTDSGAMLANSDGSAFVVTQGGASLARIESDGTVSWTDFVSANFLAAPSSQVLAVLGCDSLVAMNATTGQLIWQYSFVNATYQCASTGLATDAGGDVYASFSIYPQVTGAYETHVLKFDANGNVLWEDVQSAAGQMQVIGVGANQVYLTTGSSVEPALVQAIDTESGAVLWGVSAAYGLGLAGSPLEVLVGSAAGLQRLNAQDGSARWSQPAVGGGYFNSFIGSSDSVVIGLTKVDASTGSIIWTAVLPSMDAYNNPLFYFASGLLADASFGFVGSPYLYGTAPVVQRVDPASGELLSPVPIEPAAQGVIADNAIADPQTIVSVVPVATDAGIEIAVRAVNASDGSSRWDTTDSSLPFGYGLNSDLAGVSFGIVGANDAAAVLVSGTFAGSYNSGAAWVGAFDLTTGALRWSQLLSNPLEQQGSTSTFEPLSDPAGNVIVAYATTTTISDGEPPPTVQLQLSILKLSAVDGSVLWRHDDIFPSDNHPTYPQTIVMSGSNVLVAGGPFTSPYALSTILELSGEDGSVVWSSSALYSANFGSGSVLSVYPVDDGNVVITGADGWAKLDSTTGATIWSNVAGCANCAFGPGALVLPGGDLFYTSQTDNKLSFVVLPGSPGATPLFSSPDQADLNITQSNGFGQNLDSSGNIWLRVNRQYLYGAFIAYLAKVDPRAGTFTSQQAIFTNSRDPLLQSLSTFPLAAPENNQLLGISFTNNPPQPVTTGIVLDDTTISANGDLAVQFATDQASASTGQMVGFDLSVTYTGDAPIAGAKLIADFPWIGRAVNLVCATQAASNCEIDPRADTVVATFDMQSGGRIEVTGQFRDTGGNDPAILAAIVSGPSGLKELNTLNNGVRASVNQSLFANGFESTTPQGAPRYPITGVNSLLKNAPSVQADQRISARLH